MRDRQRNFPKANARAQRLRRKLTPAEKRLWKLLGRIEGCHFRQQAPLGPHVFDFADVGNRLLIELDGGVHSLPAVQARDEAKMAWAESQGFLVVRILNEDVFGSGESAVATVMAALQVRR